MEYWETDLNKKGASFETPFIISF